jgi:predicted Zn-dependent protease
LTSPVVVFVVRSVDSKETSGCSLNVLSDFVLIEGEDPRCLAHELGHACGLWHHRSAENVMNPTCDGTKLTK